MQPDPTEQNKNLIVALVLSTIIMISWHYFYEAPRQKAALAIRQAEQARPVPAPEANTPRAKDATPGSAPAALPRTEAIAEAPRITIASGTLHGSISLRGARFDDLTLARYRETLKKDSPEVSLLSPSTSIAPYFVDMGWLSPSGDVTAPGANTIWNSEHTRLAPDHPVVLHWENDEGVRFEQKIEMDARSMFTVTQRVINRSGRNIALTPYGMINRAREEQEEKNYILHEGALGVEENALLELDYDTLKKEREKTVERTQGWIGVTDKYWLTALIPAGGTFKAHYQYYHHEGRDRYQADLLGESIALAPDEHATYVTRFFAGAKEVWLLDEYAARFRIPFFDRAVDFGSLYFLTKPIFRMLDFFNKMLGNFGLAILLLTVLIKALLFPLANKSYKAMAQMKLLMPKMEEIRARHKGDPVQLNQEVIALYKRERVNPASGCLPVLLQIPVFFALYKVLFVTIEMRHAPFFGWIQDLSAKDPSNLFTLFGMIPWDPPAFLHLGIWPIIMTITMIVQQRISPKPNDPVQAQVMQFMPFLFLFLFASFPAGLVVYWAWNNLLSVLQQWIIMKRTGTLPEKKSRAKNMRAEDGAA
jgi:YidC/Oxa1 family membrane protein insertase